MNTAVRSLRLGFAGTPQFAVPALEALARSRHTVATVFTQPDRPAGRGRCVHASPVKQCAAALGLPVEQPLSFKTADTVELLKSAGLDALVVVAYGQILPAAALAVPTLGCFNIHASLLPRWRGAAPIHRALLAGDATTGVSIMRMATGLDTGPTLAVRSVAVDLRDTSGSLHDRLARLGGELLVETLDTIAAGNARETAQSDTGVTYAAKIDKAEAVIDWNVDAVKILRRVRAFNPWPVAETMLNGTQLRVWEAELGGGQADASPGTVLAAHGAGVDVACGHGTLRLLRLQLAGRKSMTAGDFVNAQRLTGAVFGRP